MSYDKHFSASTMSIAVPSSDSEEEFSPLTNCFYCRQSYHIGFVRTIKLKKLVECPICYEKHDYVAALPNCDHKCCRGCMTKIYNLLSKRKIERVRNEQERVRNERERTRIEMERLQTQIEERMVRITTITTQFETLTIEQKVQEIYRGMANIEPTEVPCEEMIAHRLVLKDIMKFITIHKIIQTDNFRWLLNNDEHGYPLTDDVIDRFAFQWEETRCIWKRSSSDPSNSRYSRYDKWYLICFDNGNFHRGRKNLVPPPPYIDFHAKVKFIPSSRKWMAYVSDPYFRANAFN